MLAEAGDDAAAVFVEDRLLTLDKTMADEALRTKVLPVLAGWGYNTEEQRASAGSSGYTVSLLNINLHASNRFACHISSFKLQTRRCAGSPRAVGVGQRVQ